MLDQELGKSSSVFTILPLGTKEEALVFIIILAGAAVVVVSVVIGYVGTIVGGFTYIG